MTRETKIYIYTAKADTAMYSTNESLLVQNSLQQTFNKLAKLLQACSRLVNRL